MILLDDASYTGKEAPEVIAGATSCNAYLLDLVSRDPVLFPLLGKNVLIRAHKPDPASHEGE